ncbi:flagellar export chaperone FliS [Paenibacillus mesophilus]|uniref:flagellar export chaperone FliS n=1 Tax=Paenibacillus mesophilus TaxID=2582849 RepID=UPI001EE4BA5D|nr:flagellar export chaperone FliS [Paenibacillus mesophilus]
MNNTYSQARSAYGKQPQAVTQAAVQVPPPTNQAVPSQLKTPAPQQNPSQQSKYLENTIMTAPKEQLLLLLYNVAIKACKGAKEAIVQKNYGQAHEHLLKAQEILLELMVTLDQNIPISEHLTKLYDYFIDQLIEANVKKDPAPVDLVLNFLVELRDTWAEAAKRARAGGAAIPSGTVAAPSAEPGAPVHG